MPQRKLVESQGPDTRYLENVAARLENVLSQRQRCDYELGRVIDEVMTGGYWSRDDWPGAPTGGYPQSEEGFNAWCLGFLGFKRRKAYYFRRIYLDLSALRLPETGITFQRAVRCGWTKMAEVLRVAKDEASLVNWLNRIDNEGLTLAQVQAEVKIALGSDDDEDDAAGTPRERTGTELDDGDVAPETGEPLGKGGTGERYDTGDDGVLPDGAKHKAARVEWPLSFEKAEDVRTFIKALEVAKGRMDTESNGEAALRIALYYLSNHPQQHEGGRVFEVEEMVGSLLSHSGDLATDVEGILRAVERTGVKVSVAQPAAGDAALEGFEA